MEDITHIIEVKGLGIGTTCGTFDESVSLIKIICTVKVKIIWEINDTIAVLEITHDGAGVKLKLPITWICCELIHEDLRVRGWEINKVIQILVRIR